MRRLSTVFEDVYNFKVCPRTLNTRQSTTLLTQSYKHLAGFIYDEDGKDTLLIIYYVGHSILDTTTRRLLLTQ